MGNWAIVINGVGAHHNENYPQDANKMAAEFVEKLKSAGHHVAHASFTYGGEERLLPRPELREPSDEMVKYYETEALD